MSVQTYSLVNYFDVWTDEEGGWQVNNSQVEFRDLVILDDATDKDILKYLKQIGFLKTDDMRRLVIESYGDFIEICLRKNMKPICSLRPNY